MSVILEMRNICKQFPGVLANNNVNLQVRKGEVHALLGENGAGKSTLMNVLCGLYRPNYGEIVFKGKTVEFNSAKDAMNMGIGMVHQHFMLIPTFTVAENIMIGMKQEKGLFLDIKQASARIRELSEQYKMGIDPNAFVWQLSVGQQQRVEIIKVLFRGAEILIFDEPTSVLTPYETEELFKMIRKLTSKGYTVIFISHKLNEVKSISDRVTILRQGTSVCTLDTDSCSQEELAKLMVGREVNFAIDKKPAKVGKAVLQVKNIEAFNEKGIKALKNLTLEVRSGEILGIAGVDGNGQSELVECLTGLRKVSKGSILLNGKDITRLTTREIMANEVSHIPEDRQSSGLVLGMSITENMILQDYYKSNFCKGNWLNWEFINKHCDELIKEYDIKTPSQKELASNLSGGNQQKIILAREFYREPKLLIAMHPTRGLDVGAIEYIHKKIVEQRDKGVAVLLVSTEIEEILKLSDRVIVLYEGEIMGTVEPKKISIEQLGLMMGGMKAKIVAS